MSSEPLLGDKSSKKKQEEPESEHGILKWSDEDYEHNVNNDYTLWIMKLQGFHINKFLAALIYWHFVMLFGPII
jgi:hypothetical protein